MPNTTRSAEKILSRFKELRQHLHPDEQPVFTIPAVWESDRQEGNTLCDVILTNQRLLGYYFVRFPRERLFFEELPLAAITSVSLRQETFKPAFRELLIASGQQRLSLRATPKKIEALYAALRPAIEQSVPLSENESAEAPATPPAPIYGHQDIQRPFESSTLAITILFIGGLGLEIIGLLLWTAAHNPQAGIGLCIAGLVAVITSILQARQRR
ncbi:hypothetical protein EPA93_40995 [Ktedonosporobacter rubrisoli]|uniref:Uncharacterized protein n=1 Tax=Ktedonosporobacter rubrisoli TaxID=2509675 RepID=A0A4P6K1P2_KTERU|nr:hypothetical protein [Ktedonosporobacter rubrisoli]QBD82019.1 hypothetical protein EPA93_40995 [Ktedonosporobacter rubrisoli]